MSEDSSLVELDSSLESDIELYSDTSDEASRVNGHKLQFHGESDQEATKQPVKWWQKLRKDSKYKPLSVQSGDIVPRSVETHEDSEDNMCQRFCVVPKKMASAIFNFILNIVFFHKEVPVVSSILLGLNFGLFVTLVCTAIFVYPPEINTSLRSFTIPNHPSQKHWDAFSAAKAGKFINASTDLDALKQPQGTDFKRSADPAVKRSVSSGECTPNPGQRYQSIAMRNYDNWNLDLVYKIRENVADKNLLAKERLSQIQKLENSIFTSPEYDKVCHKKSSTAACDRITSLMTSLYPTKDDGSNVYTTPDGFTPNLTASLLQFKDNPEQALWYTGGQVTIVKSTNQIKAKLLRAQLSVGLPLPCFDGVTSQNVDEQKRLVYAYYESLVPLFEQTNTGDVEVLYGGTALYDYQVDNAQFHDVHLAIVSGVLVMLVIFVLSGFSLWLTVVALYSVLSCFPWAYFVYRVVLGIESLNVLNIISLFVVIGIGVDDVFVFINTFKQSSRLKSLTNIHQRLGYTILTAGKATFVTSLTTSVAFFANAISSIPAVRQFGVFMGLVVICCYFQVLVVLPLALHIWQTFFRCCENFFYSPCLWLCKFKQSRAPEMTVRMSELDEEEAGTIIENEQTGMENSGIKHENGDGDSLDDQSESTGLIPSSDSIATTQDSNGHCDSEIQPVYQAPTENNLLGAVDLLSPYVQLAILHCIARPLMWFQLTRQFKVKFLRLDILVKLTLVLLYVVVLVISLGTVFGKLRFTDRPPQLFNSDTNIQKMLDLAGNLSESGGFTCTGGTGCGGGTLPYIPPPPPDSGTTSTTKPTPSHSTPSHATLPPTQSTPPKTQPPPTTRATTHPPPTTHQTDHPPTTHPTHPPLTTHPTPGTTHTVPATTTKGGDHTPSVTQPPTHKPTDGEEIDVVSSLYSNNLVVNVVFGIKDIKRLDTSTNFLSDGDYAVQEDSFYGNFTCSSKSDKIDLTGTLRALCRICTSISNPNNSLIMKGNYNCFPNTIVSTSFRCLYYTAQGLPECQPLFRQDTSNVSVLAEARTFYNRTSSASEIQYLAMAFRSTTSPNESPSNSIHDYQRWEEVLTEELSAIKQQSGPGEDYEGADQLLSASFQTSGKWVEVNIEALAVDGSLYGICVSILLCLLIIVFLTYNWRLFFAIKFTVLNIIFSLLAMFVVFGWPLGIVEAITLTIVVGNSLDYCIHLCEGYMSATPDHIAYVEKFKFMSRASIRVKRVAASISFVGVSIVSSAITTILATIPMLFTTIELFTRFGQILLLNTLLAITYTLVFCSTFLALFGPSDTKFTTKRALNAVITITTNVVVYPLVLFLLLYILSAVGLPILTAEGYPLFS